MFSSTNFIDAIHLYDLFVAAWAFFGAGLALVLGIGILLAGRGESRNSINDSAATHSGNRTAAARTRNRIFFVLSLCISWFLVNQSLAFSGVLLREPGLIWSDIPIIYCLGPLLYLFYQARTQMEPTEFRLEWRHALHFIAPVIALALLWPFYMLSDRETLQLLEAAVSLEYPGIFDSHSGVSFTDAHTQFLAVFRTGSFAHTPVLWIVAFASEASIIVYTLPILWNLRDVFRPSVLLAGPGANSMRWITAALTFETTVLALLGLGALAGIVELARYTAIGLTGTVCLLYFVDRAFPSYFDRLFEVGRRSRYSKSRLAHVDTDRIEERLIHEMETSHPYLRDDLTLPMLAQSLAITPHQLSELLNDRLGKSFHTVINEYRIQAACAMLNETNDTVLSIAYAVGFNNRASFNTAFTKYTGTTPVAYRRSRDRNGTTISATKATTIRSPG